MSIFTDPLVLIPDARTGTWRTARAFSYEIGAKGSGLSITVSKGFETDLATVPRFAWVLFPPADPRYAAASVLHDYLYKWDGFTRVTADALFYEAMRVLGTPRWKAITMFLAVRLWNRW